MQLLEFFSDEKRRRYLASVIAWIAIFAGLFAIRSVLLPFVLAALLAYVLDPAVSKMSSIQLRGRNLPRGLAVVLTYIALFALLALISVFFIPQLYEESVKLVKLTAEWVNSVDDARIQSWGQHIDDFLRSNNFPARIITRSQTTAAGNGLIAIDLSELINSFSNSILALVRSKSADIVSQVQAFVAGVLKFGFEFILVFMLAGFILSDTRRIRRFAFLLVPEQNHASFAAFLHRVDQGVSGVVRGQLIICLINAMLTLTGLLLLDVKFALILATIAGTLSLIPIFGSILSTIPIAIIALMKSPGTAFLAVSWIIFIHALEANFLNPKIMGNSAKIHPVLVVLALVAGEHYFGLAGALLAVPTASILLNTFNSILIKGHS